MKTLAILQFALLVLAGTLHAIRPTAAQESVTPSAMCSPWSTNYWGDVVIESQAEADEYACFRRIVGSVTLIQSNAAPFALPELRGIIGSLRIAFPSREQGGGSRDDPAALAKLLPAVREITGDIELQYPDSDEHVSDLTAHR